MWTMPKGLGDGMEPVNAHKVLKPRPDLHYTPADTGASGAQAAAKLAAYVYGLGMQTPRSAASLAPMLAETDRICASPAGVDDAHVKLIAEKLLFSWSTLNSECTDACYAILKASIGDTPYASHGHWFPEEPSVEEQARRLVSSALSDGGAHVKVADGVPMIAYPSDAKNVDGVLARRTELKSKVDWTLPESVETRLGKLYATFPKI